MCPACLASAALAVAGVTSAGGFGAFVASKLFRTETGGEDFQLRMQPEGEEDGATANRVS
jgi:hypothetical protein